MTIMPSSIPFESAVILDDDFADGHMVVTQKRHNVFAA
jgi:hypothetical protein